MKLNFRLAPVFATLVVLASACRADEPQREAQPAVAEKPADEKPKTDAPAAEQPADEQAREEKPKAEVAKKPKGPAAAIEIEALAVPFVEALQGKLDLNADNPQMQQWVGQFTEQYRSLLGTELNFIRQMCDLTPEQRPKIKAAGEASVIEAARRMAALQVRQMRGIVRDNSQPNPRQIIRDALAVVLKETLTPEQMAKYTEEATQRTALRKRAAILSVVARLDSTMCLTAEQRDKLIQSISSNWQDKWEQWLMMSAYGDQYFPAIPDALVVAHLNAEQKSVWSGLQKIDFGFWNNGGALAENDGWWGDEPAKADAPALQIRVFGGVDFF